MSRFTIAPTPLAGVVEIDRKIIGDHRGYFTRFFCAEELADAGFDSPVAQMNHSYSAKRGTVRGLHFQYPPHAEIKLGPSGEMQVIEVAARAADRVAATGDEDDVVVAVCGLARAHSLAQFERAVDDAVHARRLRREVALLEFGRIARSTLRVVAVARIEGIERGIDLRRIVLVEDGRVEAAQDGHREAGVRVGEDDAIGARQAGVGVVEDVLVGARACSQRVGVARQQPEIG
mgnify:CR=1 FL=1